MSKITFRADDDLIDQLEEFDASKSEVMREALREYLEAPDESPGAGDASGDADGGDGSIDDLIVDRVDAIIEERLNGRLQPRAPQDVNVNITLEGENASREAVSDDQSAVSHDGRHESSHASTDRKTPSREDDSAPAGGRKTCGQCGENLTGDHVYCPNCGEKAAHRVFCDCGDELRSDWGFCPSCGRRTPAADVLDNN
ncbi:double zinc ribbon domain-containing protein [Halomicrobium katesii]|uniref:double zinc ribbon domain-containing protein n=1 Tax=Halomicrobium katesii TaxID=437163 RepID=UPI0003739053|nr:zinc ribbon domain-containing protein [Halomicrobium katesii]